ncbi:hypothetical protein ACHAXN_001667 [Cyclotella atomus]
MPSESPSSQPSSQPSESPSSQPSSMVCSRDSSYHLSYGTIANFSVPAIRESIRKSSQLYKRGTIRVTFFYSQQHAI